MTINEGDVGVFDTGQFEEAAEFYSGCKIRRDIEFPPGTILSGRVGVYLKTLNGWEEYPSWHFITSNLASLSRRVEYLPSPPKEPAKIFKVGDKISTRGELSSLPKASVVRFYSGGYEEIYRCNGDGRVCVIGDDTYHSSFKIDKLGLFTDSMTILYLPEEK